jgi:hypothetical protein
VHFRNPSVPPTNEIFLMGEKQLGVVSKYQYLGLLLTEFLDYNEMAKAVARSAGRALSKWKPPCALLFTIGKLNARPADLATAFAISL